MTDYQPSYGATEGRTMPAVVYGLYLLGFATGFTVVVGIILAYVQRSAAGPVMRTHYDFAIRTFWIGLALSVVTGLVMGVGIVLSFILIGIPIVMLAGLAFCVIGIWFAIRCILGIVHLSRGEPYPRPHALLA